MPAPTCYTPLKVCRIRAVRLDANGAFVNATDNAYVSDAMAEITWEEEILDGEEILERNGCGTIMVDFQDDPQPRGRGNFTISLLQGDPELIELLAGGTILTSAGATVGYEPPSGVHNGCALEAWTWAWDGDERATSGGTAQWFRFAFPKVVCTPPPQNLGNQSNVLNLSGQASVNSNFGTGPAGDWPASISRPGAYFITTTAPPAAACGTSQLAIAS